MNKNDQVSTRWGRYSKVAVWQRRLGVCVLAPCFIAWLTGTVGRPPRKPAVIANVPIKSTSAWGEPERSVRLYRKIKKEKKLQTCCRLQGNPRPRELLRTGLVWAGSSHKIQPVYLKEYETINRLARNVGPGLTEWTCEGSKSSVSQTGGQADYVPGWQNTKFNFKI